MSATWMLYGATGYSGTLLAEEAKARGERPVLAGRNEKAVRKLAERLNLPSAVFGLDDAETLRRELAPMSAVLLAAGPFSATSQSVVDACLATATHYLDITGEVDVFEAIHARDREARAARCVLMPGVGFDVVPSDCLSAVLAQALPAARQLELAFHVESRPSQGTIKSALERIPRGAAVRREGSLERVPMARHVKTIPFDDQPRPAATIPWGDLSTAYHSTGIQNIETFMAMPKSAARALRWSRPVSMLLRSRMARRLFAAGIDLAGSKRGGAELGLGPARLWGRVEDSDGTAVEGTLVTPEAYHLTVLTALECTDRVVTGDVGPGAWTPSQAFGPRFIQEFEGCELHIAAVP